MRISALSIEGAWLVEPVRHDDERGTFLECFKADALAQVVGHHLTVAQSNLSTSGAGTLRGIHFAELPPGQAKYVTCVSGAVLDVVVDIRPGSPTFGQHELVHLDQVNRHALYLSEGLGHGYMALTDGAAFLYLCSTPYAPGREHGVHPLDPALGIPWPTRAPDGGALTPRLSPKDQSAPGLAEVQARGLLASHESALSFRRALA